MIVTCCLLSLILVRRLFAVVKPKLLAIPWFAKLWKALLSVCTCVIAWFGQQRATTS
jgi:hypothetical protein